MSDTSCWAALTRLLSLMSAETGHAAGDSRLHMCSAPTSGATVQAHMGMLRAARWLLEHEGTTVSKVMQDTG